MENACLPSITAAWTASSKKPARRARIAKRAIGNGRSGSIPWICGRCAREFTLANLRELTVHHRDHNHDNNPPDGSNWELLCIYCHDNEHQKQIEADRGNSDGRSARAGGATHSPFAGLQSLLKPDQRS